MKLMFYDDYKLGAVKGNSVVDLADALDKTQNASPQDRLNDLIENFSVYQDKLAKVIEQNPGVSIDQVKVMPPVPKPTNSDIKIRYLKRDVSKFSK